MNILGPSLTKGVRMRHSRTCEVRVGDDVIVVIKSTEVILAKD